MTKENEREHWLHEIVERYERPLCQYAYSILGNADLAGEVVQDTFLRLWKQDRSRVEDHVAPWQSVYKINLLADTEVTFLLTSGGHNAGIVSEPGHPRRSFQVVTRQEGSKYLEPKTWRNTVPTQQGSWWPVWATWLEEISDNNASPPTMGAPQHGYAPLQDAPGSYVLLGNNDQS